MGGINPTKCLAMACGTQVCFPPCALTGRVTELMPTCPRCRCTGGPRGAALLLAVANMGPGMNLATNLLAQPSIDEQPKQLPQGQRRIFSSTLPNKHLEAVISRLIYQRCSVWCVAVRGLWGHVVLHDVHISGVPRLIWGRLGGVIMIFNQRKKDSAPAPYILCAVETQDHVLQPVCHVHLGDQPSVMLYL